MLDKIKNNIKSKQGKVLIGNFFSLSALHLVGMLLPLITLPYVLRVIGLEKYGLIALALSLVAYFNSIVDFSFRITATRDVAVFRNSPKKLNLIYSKVTTVKAIFLTLSLILLTLIIIIYPPFYEEKFIFFSASLSLIGYMLFPEWFFQGMEKMKYITVINIIVKVAFALSVFVFIKEENDYILYPLMTSLGLFFSGLAGQYILIKKYKLKFYRMSFKRIKSTININIPIFVNQFIPNLYNNTGGFLLGIFCAPTLLGLYTAVRQIIDLAITLLTIISRVFFPYLNKNKSAFYIYKKIMFTLTVLGVLIIILSNQIIFWYLDIDYSSGIWVLILLSLSIIGNTAYDVFGLNYFIVNNEDNLVMSNTIKMSIIGFIITIPLIYFFDIIGAALSLMLSRSLMGGGLYLKFFQLKNTKNN